MSTPFRASRDEAPAYWMYGILWVPLVEGHQTAGSYWFRADIASDCYVFNDGEGLAVWTYDSVTPATPLPQGSMASTASFGRTTAPSAFARRSWTATQRSGNSVPATWGSGFRDQERERHPAGPVMPPSSNVRSTTGGRGTAPARAASPLRRACYGVLIP